MLAMQLCGDAFTPDEKSRNFDYYERITVRDSSLSACTQAVLAAEVGHLRLALDYVAEAALIDLQDIEHNACDGLHIAALAGTWIAVVAGFGGMRDHGGTLSFAPRLPDGLTSLSFTIVRRGLRLHVSVSARRGHVSTARCARGAGARASWRTTVLFTERRRASERSRARRNESHPSNHQAASRATGTRSDGREASPVAIRRR